MIQFSTHTQQFYDMSLDYPQLPDDLVSIDLEQHHAFLTALNEGRYILDDFSFSEPRPTHYHTWQDGQWVDLRTDEQKQVDEQKMLFPLTRRQFKLVLLKHKLLKKVEQSIADIQDETLQMQIQIEYEESTSFERNSQAVGYMCQLLALNTQQIDAMWEEALQL